METGPLTSYEVDGLPAGEKATIAQMRGRARPDIWHFLRAKNGVDGVWTGEYETAEDALDALQKQVDAEQWGELSAPKDAELVGSSPLPSCIAGVASSIISNEA